MINEQLVKNDKIQRVVKQIGNQRIEMLKVLLLPLKLSDPRTGRKLFHRKTWIYQKSIVIKSNKAVVFVYQKGLVASFLSGFDQT